MYPDASSNWGSTNRRSTKTWKDDSNWRVRPSAVPESILVKENLEQQVEAGPFEPPPAYEAPSWRTKTGFEGKTKKWEIKPGHVVWVADLVAGENTTCWEVFTATGERKQANDGIHGHPGVVLSQEATHYQVSMVRMIFSYWERSNICCR